jgi:hypothetical protein
MKFRAVFNLDRVNLTFNPWNLNISIPLKCYYSMNGLREKKKFPGRKLWTLLRPLRKKVYTTSSHSCPIQGRWLNKNFILFFKIKYNGFEVSILDTVNNTYHMCIWQRAYYIVRQLEHTHKKVAYFWVVYCLKNIKDFFLIFAFKSFFNSRSCLLSNNILKKVPNL